jgi:hypothetical protein
MSDGLKVVADCRCESHLDAEPRIDHKAQAAKDALLGAITQMAGRAPNANALHSLVEAYAVVVGTRDGNAPPSHR